jgi:dsRNA-specific ribonuclease
VTLQVETCQWGRDTEQELERLVSSFLSDMLLSSSHLASEPRQDAPEATKEQRAMRLRAMSTCLSPSRALSLLLDHHQALLAAIYLSQQAEKRAKAMPQLLPASTHLYWEPGHRPSPASARAPLLDTSLHPRLLKTRRLARL